MRVCEFAGVEQVDLTTGVDYWSGLLERTIGASVAADYAHPVLVDMLRTDLKFSAHFKTVWTVLKPSGPF